MSSFYQYTGVTHASSSSASDSNYNSSFQHMPPIFAAPPAQPEDPSRSIPMLSSPGFDLFEWHPQYASCQRYLLEHAQFTGPVQAVAAFLNILLPFQRQRSGRTHHQHHPQSAAASVNPNNPFSVSPSTPPVSSHQYQQQHQPLQPAPAILTSTQQNPLCVSLIPYIRRLVATGMDFPGVLHGFFGDSYSDGIGPLHEQERRNFLFSAKSGGWAAVKAAYDMGPLETIPFVRPLQNAGSREIEAAERAWSEWLLMEDWLVGDRQWAPGTKQEDANSSQPHQPRSRGNGQGENASTGGDGGGGESGGGVGVNAYPNTNHEGYDRDAASLLAAEVGQTMAMDIRNEEDFPEVGDAGSRGGAMDVTELGSSRNGQTPAGAGGGAAGARDDERFHDDL